MSDAKAETAESILSRRVSEWLEPEAKCVGSSYDCNTNYGWCSCDVQRLKNGGVRAGVVRNEGKVAVFRLLPGETPADVAQKLASLDAEEDNCE